jgi:hypothetical protein
MTAGLCSEHFTVDGTLIESWAALKSFHPIEPGEAGPADGNGFQPRNPDVDFRGQERTNATHRSRTDPEARLHARGGQGVRRRAVPARRGGPVGRAACASGQGAARPGGGAPSPTTPPDRGPAADEGQAGRRGVSAQPEVPEEDRGGVRVAQVDRRTRAEPGGWAVEVTAVAGGRGGRVQPGPAAVAEAGVTVPRWGDGRRAIGCGAEGVLGDGESKEMLRSSAA